MMPREFELDTDKFLSELELERDEISEKDSCDFRGSPDNNSDLEEAFREVESRFNRDKLIVLIDDLSFEDLCLVSNHIKSKIKTHTNNPQPVLNLNNTIIKDL